MLLEVFRPNLIDYINLSKVLDNYTRGCKCTSGESRVGLVCGGGGGGGVSFSLKNISSFCFVKSTDLFFLQCRKKQDMTFCCFGDIALQHYKGILTAAS